MEELKEGFVLMQIKGSIKPLSENKIPTSGYAFKMMLNKHSTPTEWWVRPAHRAYLHIMRGSQINLPSTDLNLFLKNEKTINRS